MSVSKEKLAEMNGLIFLHRSLGSGYLPASSVGPLLPGEHSREALKDEHERDLDHAAPHDMDSMGDIMWVNKEDGIGFYRDGNSNQVVETVRVTKEDVPEDEWSQMVKEALE